ncbi:MAG: hypothetical protein LBI18_11910, partial [Planctomycetaceae bacterium]|nr:hypothetical protein [Planctomycetaceae bacterium]
GQSKNVLYEESTQDSTTTKQKIDYQKDAHINVSKLHCTGTVFNRDLTDFVTSDNVDYVQLTQHFSYYNDFNETTKSLLPLQNMLPNLIVKDRKFIVSYIHDDSYVELRFQ